MCVCTFADPNQTIDLIPNNKKKDLPINGGMKSQSCDCSVFFVHILKYLILTSDKKVDLSAAL